MTQAVIIEQHGGPEELKLVDVTVGQPGPGEIRIRHKAIGLNFIDIYFRQGDYPAPLPFTPGNEGAGEVVALGKGVEDLRAYGSGKTGFTNALRSLGLRWAVLVMVGDIGKGLLAVLLCRMLVESPWAGALAGAAAVLGHIVLDGVLHRRQQ